MLQNKTMASKRENFNMKKVPLRSFNLRSLSTANKLSLKEKLTAELALVRSAINNTEQCCKRASNNTIRSSCTKQQQVPANRKRKSNEITHVLKKVKNANSISNVAHLSSQANPSKVLSEATTNFDSKNSVGALRKKHCSDSNEQIKIEAQIKTAAAQKEKSEFRMKIKKEREASRLALEKMEATVEMNDFNQVMKELKGIGCQNISFYVLRQLGLFLKDDDSDDHKTAQISVLANDEIEEGEFCT